jgi:hypothetical protein
VKAALLALVLAAACGRVRPWQRETLASPALEEPPWPAVHRGEQHVYEVREGSSGATGAAGGGCGCN